MPMDQLCGPRCAMHIIQASHPEVTLVGLAEEMGYGEPEFSGTSADTLVTSLSQYGIDGKAVTVEPSRLETLPPLSIVHTRLSTGNGHFIVLHGCRDGIARLWDGEDGYVTIPISELTRSFTGHAVVVSQIPAGANSRQRAAIDCINLAIVAIVISTLSVKALTRARDLFSMRRLTKGE